MHAEGVRRTFVVILLVAVVGFLVYATTAPHAERPCIVKSPGSCAKALQEEKK
jgi:hypothetical protein